MIMKPRAIITLLLVTLMVPAANATITVQAHYEMGDNGSGSNNLPTDSSGNGRDYQNNINSATITLSGGGYNNDAYYSFDGSTQAYYGTGYDAPEDNVGIEVWTRTSNLAQVNTHLFGTGSNVTGLNIGYDAAGGTGWFGAVGGIAFVGTVGTANYTSNDWIHLAVVRDNGTSTFYVNGVASGTAGNTPNDANTPHMAVTSGATAYFGGDLAEARIFTFTSGEFSTGDLIYPSVPEPATTSLCALVFGFGLLRRRRCDSKFRLSSIDPLLLR